MADISLQELKVIVENELQNAMGSLEDSGELSKDRATAMDRYLGEPLGTEMEGRSQVHTRDVLDVIEWILPSLIRIFIDAETAVEIAPVGPEDEETAEQETDYLNYLFFQKNPGFLVLYTWFKDALLQKNGIVKSYAEEEDETKRESYNDLTEIELVSLVQDDSIEIVEFTAKTSTSDTGQEIPTYDVVVVKHNEGTEICVENLPPEEFAISRDARSVNPKKARFTAHITEKTVSELKEMGFKDDQIDQMEDGPSHPSTSEEEIARKHLSDEQTWQEIVLNEAMKTKMVNECYLRADANGDGYAELLKVWYSGEFIDYEEVDYNPFAAITPVILTHKFFGLSVADIIIDLQEIRTAIMRSYLDNFYQTINGTTYYDINNVNVDDMLTSKPYGIRAVDGPPGESVFHIPPNGLPPQAFSLFELTDQLKTSRIGDFQGQIDPSVMEKANTGVVVRLINEAKAKVEMIARIFAETGVKDLFRDLHELSRKHSSREDVVRLRGQWTPINPQSFRERTDFRVRVGLGHRTRHEKLADLRDIMDIQQRLVEGGGLGSLLLPGNIYEAVSDYINELGHPNADKYVLNPQNAPPPPPQPPDANMALVQQQHHEAQMKRQTDLEKNQIEAAKVQGEQALKQMETQLKAEMERAKQSVAGMETHITELKTLAQIQNDQVKNALTERAQSLESQVKQIQTWLTAKQGTEKNLMEQYKADLGSATSLIVEQIKQGQNGEQADEKADKILASLMDRIDSLESSLDRINGPKEIKRDEQGRIIAIGNKKVNRDGSGRAISVE